MKTATVPDGPKLLILFSALVLMIMALNTPPLIKHVTAQNLSTREESLSSTAWNGSECCKGQFDFTHKSGLFFSAQRWNPNGQQLAEGNITVNIWNNTLKIIKGGGSAEGEYWCDGRFSGTWRTVIRL